MQKKVFVLTIFLTVLMALQGFSIDCNERKELFLAKISEASHDTLRIRLLNELAHHLYMEDENDSCLKYASLALKLSDSLLISETAKNNQEYSDLCKKLKSISLFTFGKGLENQNTTAALDTLQNALKLVMELGDYVTAGDIYSAIGNIHDFTSQNELALSSHLKSLELYRQAADSIGLAGQLANVAIVHRNIGNYGDAMEYLMESLKISRQINDSSSIVEALLAMGFVYLYVERYEEALDVQNEALGIYEQMNDSLGIARIYNDMGVVAEASGNLYAALEQHLRALAIRLKSDLVYNIFASYMYIGAIYEDLKMYPEALDSYLASLEYARRVGFKITIIDSHLNIGSVYFKQQNFSDALDHFNSALELSREIHNGTSEAIASLNIAKVYQARENHSSALNWLRKAEKIAPKSSLRFLGNIYQSIALTYFKLGDFENAYINMIRYDEVKDSIIVAENLSKVTTLTNKLEFENKQALQNESHKKILELKQSEIDRQKIVRNFILFGMGVILILAIIYFVRFIEKNKLNSKLNSLLKDLRATQSQLIQSEKMASLGELTAGIAHEIQNPLNFINNFSEVNTELLDELKEEIAAGNIEDVLAILNDLSINESKINQHGKRAGAIVKGMLMHSQIGSGEKEVIDINAYADEYLRIAYHGMRAKDQSFKADFKTDCDPGLAKLKVIPQDFGRVLINLINNAFYAVAEKSKQYPEDIEYKPFVLVSTKNLGGKVEVSVKDNGNGIPESIKDKIFQPFFTTKAAGEGTGLGLSLSYDIITKGHGGEILVKTRVGQGTEFIILLPITIQE